MHFFMTLFLGAAALSSAVAAKSTTLYFTSSPSDVTVGHSMDITYMAPNVHEPVTIKLRKGESTNLHTVSVLTQAASGGKFTWTPSTELRSGSDYALEIIQDSEDNYTGEFSIDNPKAKTNSAYRATPITSMHASITGLAGTASSGLSIPMSRNHTFSSATLPATATTLTAAVTTAPAPTATTTHKGAASVLNSNMAFVFGAIAAVAYLA